MNIDQSPVDLATDFSVPYALVPDVEHPDCYCRRQDRYNQQSKFKDIVSFVLVHVSPSLIALP